LKYIISMKRGKLEWQMRTWENILKVRQRLVDCRFWDF